MAAKRPSGFQHDRMGMEKRRPSQRKGGLTLGGWVKSCDAVLRNKTYPRRGCRPLRWGCQERQRAGKAVFIPSRTTLLFSRLVFETSPPLATAHIRTALPFAKGRAPRKNTVRQTPPLPQTPNLAVTVHSSLTVHDARGRPAGVRAQDAAVQDIPCAAVLGTVPPLGTA